MDGNVTLQRMELIEALAVLESLLLDLAAAVTSDSTLPAEVVDERGIRLDGTSARGLAAEAYAEIYHQDDGDGRRTCFRPGLVAAGPDTLALAQQVNVAKDRFRAARKALQTTTEGKKAYERILERLPGRSPVLTQLLRRAGKSRIHLLQADRHIPLLPDTTRRVAFTWGRRDRSIYRISVPEARQKLEALGDAAHVEQQLQRLEQLPADERLAVVYNKSPYLRANIYCEGASRPFHVRAALPLLVPPVGGRLPEHTPPTRTPPDGARLVRADERIDSEPFLPSIHVHRYRDASGASARS